jgi:hypothetical protein
MLVVEYSLFAFFTMQTIALLFLLVGFIAQTISNGQTFTHAVFGMVCGIAAVFCGLGSARKADLARTPHWPGRIVACLGLAFALYCMVRLPSTYRGQKSFNEMNEKAHENREQIWTSEKPL